MQVSDILRNRWVQTSLISVVAFAGGGVGGYFLGKRKAQRVEIHVVQPTDEQLALFEEVEEIQITESITETTIVEVEDDGYIQRIVEAQHEDPSEDEPAVVTVLVDDGDWDYEAEMSTRDPRAPYILHQEEFIGDELGYRQETVTYYAGDQIMSDNNDTPLYGFEDLMGELQFGHGSRDPNVVYIRNEVIHMEWEVLRDEGSFSEQVLGIQADREVEDEIRHSGVQKFRRD